jgi:hypothetical protein
MTKSYRLHFTRRQGKEYVEYVYAYAFVNFILID